MATTRGEKVAHYEDVIRRDPRSPHALEAFQAAVKNAGASPRGDMYVRVADLADIEGASFSDETGELLMYGPKITDQDVMPPLLWDDFVAGLRAAEAGLGPAVAIQPGSKNSGSRKATAPRSHKVRYLPASLSDTHAGRVVFEAQRLLWSLAEGKDVVTGTAIRCPVPGYRPLSNQARGRLWFRPQEPQVAVDGYTMKFVR
ncbi:MAG: hypothetical protein R6U98_16250, partial [Pirellulaceae bacterium]